MTMPITRENLHKAIEAGLRQEIRADVRVEVALTAHEEAKEELEQIKKSIAEDMTLLKELSR